MAQIMEISNAAYEARDHAQAEMIALKSQADKEQANFELEWAQLAQLIEKDRKMKGKKSPQSTSLIDYLCCA
jgi:hypothetical protein